MAAGDIQLEGKPVLSKAIAHQATLMFQTDAPLPRRDGGGIKASVEFDRGVSSVATSSHDDKRYTSWLKTNKTLKSGMSFKVKIKIDGQDAIVRTVRVR